MAQKPKTPALRVDRHVRRTGEDYLYSFLSLLPTGQAWPKHSPDSTLYQTSKGLTDFWGFVDTRASILLEIESDPRQTLELLPDWERAWGLPDPCFGAPLTIAARQQMLVMWMTLMGGQSREFFSYAASLIGYTIAVEDFREWSPFMVGISRVGDTRDPGSVMPWVYRWEIGRPEMRFYWSVKVGGVRLEWFRCGWHGSQCGVDPHLQIAAALDLECVLRRWKPAHTEIIFDYSGLGPPDSMAGTP